MLKSLGFDNLNMLMAAQHRDGEDIFVTDRLKVDGNNEKGDGMIAALFGKAVFHNKGQFEDD